MCKIIGPAQQLVTGVRDFLARVDDGEAVGHKLAVAEIGLALHLQYPVEGIADLADVHRRVVDDHRGQRHIAAGLPVGVEKGPGVAHGVAGESHAAAAELAALRRELVEDERIRAGGSGQAVGDHRDVQVRDVPVKLTLENHPGGEDDGDLGSGRAQQGIDVERSERGGRRRGEDHDLGHILAFKPVVVESPDAERRVQGKHEVAHSNRPEAVLRGAYEGLVRGVRPVGNDVDAFSREIGEIVRDKASADVVEIVGSKETAGEETVARLRAHKGDRAFRILGIEAGHRSPLSAVAGDHILDIRDSLAAGIRLLTASDRRH